MSDPTPGAPDEPEVTPDIAGGDETMRIPVTPPATPPTPPTTPPPAPEVAWDALEAPRAMPWEAPTTAQPAPPLAPIGQAAGTPAPDGSQGPAPAGGVLSAATVGWVAPPPEPVATGKPGWVIASTGIRFVAYLIDGIITGVLLGIGVAVVLTIAPDLATGGTPAALAYGVASAGLFFVYFVGFWTGGGQATPGMRLFKMRVANASDGKRLTFGPAVIRWLALGYIFTVVSVVPALAGLGLLGLIWLIVLLVTTATDTMHQGLHDKWAKSVVVRPEGVGAGGGLVVACLILALIIIAFTILPIIALILLGSQVSNILSAVGSSI